MNTLLTILIGWTVLSAICYALVNILKIEYRIASLKAQEATQGAIDHA